MSKELTFFELTKKLKNGELKIGQRFKTKYGSTLYVGTQEEDNDKDSENMALKWLSTNKFVGVTQLVTDTTYCQFEEYEVITFEEMFKMLLNGESDSVYYNVRDGGHKPFPDKYYHVSNIETLNKNNIFNENTLSNDVRFYKKMF